jgi:hypothetical protein
MQDTERTESTKNSSSSERGERPATNKSLSYALIGGVAGGMISIIFNTALTFLNAPTFQQATVEGSHIEPTIAYELLGLALLNFFIILLTCFIAGYLLGHMTAQRRQGTYAGAIVSTLTYAGSFVVRYIPNYPGNLTNTGSSAFSVGSIILPVVFLCIWAGIGSLLGLWGAHIATRRRRA